MFIRRRLFLSLILIFLYILIYVLFKKEDFNSKVLKYCNKNKLILNENFYSNIIYINELNLLYCDIPKSASTNLRRLIYVYLNQTNTFENLTRKNLWIDLKNFFNKFYLKKNSKLIFENKNLFKFLIVRHPFQRIYSVYYDKFLNNHLDDTLFGWKQLEEDILLEIQTNETLLTIRRKDLNLDLRTFLLYIINSIKKKRLMNIHWEQIVYHCGFCFINYDWIGKIENFHFDQQILLKKLNKNSFQFPSKQFDQNENKQKYLNDSQLFQLFRQTIQNDQEFQILIDYYKPDFHLFNYHLPLLN